MSTVKDNASVTTSSGGGFFKRLGRKRSLSGVGSPKSPTSPVLDSAPWLPPLAGLDGEDSLAPPGVPQPQQPASTSSPAPRTSRLSLSSNSGPPILNLPGYIAPPVLASASSNSASSKPSPQFFKGGPQLSMPARLDTSLHLEVTQSGILTTTPTAEKPQTTEVARTTSPSPSAVRATSPAPPSTHTASTSPPRPSRKEPSISSDKSNLEKSTSITKAFGSLFKRSKTRDHLDTLPAPVEEKRKSSTSKRLSLLPEKKETTPPPSAAAAAHTNGAAKAESPTLTESKPAPAETVVVPPVVAAAAAATAAPVGTAAAAEQAETPATGLAQTGKTFTTDDGEVRTFGEEAPVGGFTRPAGFAKTSPSGLRAEEPAAPVAEFAQSGKTFTTDDGEVKTFGEAAPVGGFARPAGFAKTNLSSLRAEPVEEPAAPVAEAVPAPAPTSEFAQSGKTFTTDDGEVKTFGEAAPVGGFARPAGFTGAKASALRAEPVDETPVAEAAPAAGLAQTGAVFTTNDGEVKTFGEAAPVGGFTRPAGFECQSASALRAEPVEETPAPVAEAAPVQTEETPSSSIGAEGTTFTTNDGETRKFGEPAPAGGFPKPAGFAGSSVRALRAQFEQSKKAAAAEVFKNKTPSPPPAEHVALQEPVAEEPKVEETPVVEEVATPAVVEEAPAPVVEEPETAAAPVVEEAKPVEASNGDARKAEETEEDRVPTPEPKAAAPAS